MGELHLGLEIRDGAKATHDRRGAVGPYGVYGQAVEGRDDRAVGRQAGCLDRGAEDLDPSLGWQQWRLPGIGQDGHDHPIEDGECPAEHVEMPVRHGIEGPGVDRDPHASASVDSTAR